MTKRTFKSLSLNQPMSCLLLLISILSAFWTVKADIFLNYSTQQSYPATLFLSGKTDIDFSEFKGAIFKRWTGSRGSACSVSDFPQRLDMSDVFNSTTKYVLNGIEVFNCWPDQIASVAFSKGYSAITIKSDWIPLGYLSVVFWYDHMNDIPIFEISRQDFENMHPIDEILEFKADLTPSFNVFQSQPFLKKINAFMWSIIVLTVFSFGLVAFRMYHFCTPCPRKSFTVFMVILQLFAAILRVPFVVMDPVGMRHKFNYYTVGLIDALASYPIHVTHMILCMRLYLHSRKKLSVLELSILGKFGIFTMMISLLIDAISKLLVDRSAAIQSIFITIFFFASLLPLIISYRTTRIAKYSKNLTYAFLRRQCLWILASYIPILALFITSIIHGRSIFSGNSLKYVYTKLSMQVIVTIISWLQLLSLPYPDEDTTPKPQRKSTGLVSDIVIGGTGGRLASEDFSSSPQSQRN